MKIFPEWKISGKTLSFIIYNKKISKLFYWTKNKKKQNLNDNKIAL